MSTWDNTPQRSLLSAENLERVRSEFGNDGVIFGFHYYYYGGASGTDFTFSDYDSYYQEVVKSRPGDHFTGYSANRVADRAILRIGTPDSDQPISIDHRFAVVKNARAAKKDVVVLWRKTASRTGRIECDIGAWWWDFTDEDLEQFIGIGSGRSGELMVFLMDTLDEDEEGVPIVTVSCGERKRVNAVIDGKRPNEDGLTPVSGCY